MKMVYFITAAILAYSAYVLFALCSRDEYSKDQKIAQACLVIFIPLIGAIIVHGFIREFDRVAKPRNPNDGQGVDGMPGGTQ